MREDDFALRGLTIPAIRPNETLYSWAGLFHRFSGSCNVLLTSRRLYGKPYSALLHDFPANLDTLSERTSHCLGPSEELALRRTLLGFFLATLDRHKAIRLLQLVLRESASSIKLQLGIPATRLGGYHPLKGCVECFEEDVAAFESAYWHVDHQLPSVWICARHDRVLRYVDSPSTPVHLRDWILPSLGNEPRWATPRVLGSNTKSHLLRMAHFSTALANRSPGEIDRSVLASTYRRRLAKRGLSTDHGQLRIQPLLREVRALLAGLDEIPVFQRFFASDALANEFLSDIARRRPKRGHPLKHACMLALLFDDWPDFHNEFQASLLHGADMEFDFCSHAIGARRPESTRSAFLNVIHAGAKSIRTASQAAGVSTTTGLQWAANVGYPIQRRPKKLKPANLEHVRTLLALGIPKIDVARTAGISAVTLSRVLARDKALDEIWKVARHSSLRELNRNRLIGCIESRPGVPIGVIRKSELSGYQWLYRNDRDWLKKKIAALRSLHTSKHSTKRTPKDPDRGPTA